MKITSVREEPGLASEYIDYFQKHWASEASKPVYRDCIEHTAVTESALPHWFLLRDGERIVGCVGLIANDFVSRQDLWPWVCGLFIEPEYRGHALGSLLLARAEDEARKQGFTRVYLITDHVGLYEHYGYHPIGTGYHPWGETSTIYEKNL